MCACVCFVLGVSACALCGVCVCMVCVLCVCLASQVLTPADLKFVTAAKKLGLSPAMILTQSREELEEIFEAASSMVAVRRNSEPRLTPTRTSLRIVN